MTRIEELYELFKKCGGVTTDSRKITPGSMFFALKGDRFDGNDYARQALEAGARYAVVDRPSLFSLSAGGLSKRRAVPVENALAALQQLAAYHRSRFDIPVVGITGTNGKTTTKELVSAVLSRRYETIYTEGNLNNHIGVPLTLLRIGEKCRMAVIEMGASFPGEIALLARIARPTCGIVTNVGKAHLQGFGSFENIKKTKGELCDALRQSGGLLFYNADNPVLCDMVASRKGLRTFAYGVVRDGAEILPVTADEPFLRMHPYAGGPLIETSLVGGYNADNVLAALAVGRHFEVPEDSAVAALRDYVPRNDRSQMVRTASNCLIVDAYNANPTSMMAALDNFGKGEFSSRTVILGDMLELGKASLEEHRQVVLKALQVASEVFLAGGEFAAAAEGMDAPGLRLFPTAEALRDYLTSNPLSGRTILIKGSHGMHLERMKDIL